MRKEYLVIGFILLLSISFVTGCSKKPEQIDNLDSTADLRIRFERTNESVIDIAKETGVIIDYEEFKNEMREKKEIIKVKEVTPPEVSRWLMDVKNVSDESIICFGDIDCPQTLKCITQCQIVLGPEDLKGQIRACHLESVQDDPAVIPLPVGFCLEWKK